MRGKGLSPDQLDRLRIEAVSLRLNKLPLQEISRRTGLTPPTIIDAYKRFTRGGWQAVKTRRRGRPKAAAGRDELPRPPLSLAPEAVDRNARLWTEKLLGSWLGQQGLSPSPRTLKRYAQRWGINPPALFGANPAEARGWVERHYPEPLREADAGGRLLLMGGMAPLPDDGGGGGHLLFARDRRGAPLWLTTPERIDPVLIVDFFRRLLSLRPTGVTLLFKCADLNGFAPIRAWLDAQAPHFRLVQIPGTPAPAPAPGPTGGDRPTHPPSSTPRNPMPLTHLQRLEAESMHIMREVVAEADNPVMLYSIGKDSSVMLHLAMKAFYPSKPPFPLLHVDTTWKFRDMYAFRDQVVADNGLDLLIHTNPDGLTQGINPFTHGSAIHTDIMKTEALKQALDKYQFDVAFGGARRDEEKSRAKERVFSFRSSAHRWDPKAQRPEVWRLYNGRKHRGESIRVFPLSNWTELDIWQYIHLEQIPIVPLYLAAERPVVERDGALIMVDDERMPLNPGEVPLLRKVRFRTLGCYPLTGAIESEAETLPAVIQEMLLTRTSERQGRVIDHDSAASMEKKKQEGYF